MACETSNRNPSSALTFALDLNYLIRKLFMKIEKFLNKSPLVPLVMIGKSLHRGLEARVAKYELNWIDSLIVAAIFFETSPVRPGQLARSLRFSRSQISQSLQRLEESGLIARSLAKNDLRSMEIRLTAAGKQTATKLIDVFDEQTRLIEKRIGRESSEKLAAVLSGFGLE